MATHPVQPLATLPAGPVLVDGHPICGHCGKAVGPVRDGWRHVPATTAYPPPSMAPITWNRLRPLRSYGQFADRFGWAVRAAVPTSEVDFTTGMRRLTRYTDLLSRTRRRRTLAPGDNPYLDLLTVLLDATAVMSPGLARILDLRTRRRELAGHFAWSVPDETALARLAGLGPLVESGAGTGYWSALLAARGGDVVSYDLAPPGGAARNPHHPGHRTWTRVAAADSAIAVRLHPQRTLLLCWPPMDHDAAGYGALRAYRGDVLAYIGDGPGGAAGTPRLHRELELNWTATDETALPGWPGIHDRLTVYRRNPSRRRHSVRDRCDECRRYVPTGWIGRCHGCRARRPAALTLRYGPHLLEYPAEVLAGMPYALAEALRHSIHRVSG